MEYVLGTIPENIKSYVSYLIYSGIKYKLLRFYSLYIILKISSPVIVSL